MLNEDLIGLVDKKEDIVIVGNGDIGKYLYDLLLAADGRAKIAICDNARSKQGYTGEYEVISVEKAVTLFPDALFLITSSIHENTIRNQLMELGIPKEHAILGITKEAQDYLAEKKRAVKQNPLQKLQFEVDVVSHCNLNCKCCSQFSCIAEEEYIDIHKMENDFKRLGELFDGEAKRIYLIGGEPLLHPQITTCMEIARRYFHKGEISVFTNGLLLLKCGEAFWRECRKSDISIIITKYPISLDYQKIMNKAEEEGIRFSFFGTSEDFKYMTNLALDIQGKQDVEKNFVSCAEANNCIKLRDGKLFTCTRPAAIYRFNRFFGKNLELSDEDSIDIYKERTREEILKKLAAPIPFCRYCNIFGERKASEWGQTERKIEEWQ